MEIWLSILIPTLILLAGLVDDLRSKKIHNWLILSLAAGAILFRVVFEGWPGLNQGLLGGAAAMALMMPLVAGRALGAGDLKLMMAFGLAVTWPIVFWTLIYSLVWGALLGLARAFISGEGVTLLKNTVMVLSPQKRSEIDLHEMPYSVALVFGWITHLSLTGWGGLA